MKPQVLVLLFILAYHITVFGQNARYGKNLHIEYHPSYTPWKKNYTLSKVRYFEKRIVLDIKLTFNRNSTSWTKSVAFSPPNKFTSWCLKDSESGQVFQLLEIRNITRNGKEIKNRVKAPKDKLFLEMTAEGKPTEVFTCEAHFAPLPDNIAMVDLLEGPDSKGIEGHWNFFDIKIKQFGKKTTSIVEVEDFNQPDSTALAFAPKENSKAATSLKLKHPNLSSIHDIECNKILELSNIAFQDNSTKFQNSTDAERTLFILSTYLKQSPKSIIELYGHTDIFGDTTRNLELSKQRVEKLKNWFQKQKIIGSRIQTIALGDTQPIFPEGNARNRRVEVKILCSKSD